MKINKYDIWLVNLNPTKWSEQKWIRPCLVYQNNIIWNSFNTVIIMPISWKLFAKETYAVNIGNYKKYWLSKSSSVLCFQLRVVDKIWFIKKIWNINDCSLVNKIRLTASLCLDFDDDFLEV